MIFLHIRVSWVPSNNVYFVGVGNTSARASSPGLDVSQQPASPQGQQFPPCCQFLNRFLEATQALRTFDPCESNLETRSKLKILAENRITSKQ